MTHAAAAKTNVDTIATQTGAGKDSLGCVFWFKVAGRHDHARLAAAFAARGLDKLVPSAIDTERAFRRSVRRTVGSSNTLVRPVVDDNKSVVLGVVSERADSRAQDLDYQVVDRLGFDKATGAVNSSNSVTQAAVESEIRSLEHMVEGQDLTVSIVRWVGQVAGCALRENGGVYWVPPAAAAQLKTLGEAIEEGTGGACSVYVLPLSSSAEAERGIGDSAKAGMESQLALIAREVEEFKTEAPSRRSLENRLVKFQELRQRATMYRDLLKVSAGDLEEKISAMEGAVREMLAAGPAATDKKPAAPKFEAGEAVQVKAENVATYAPMGVTAKDVLTIVGQGPVKGTAWATTQADAKLIFAKAHLEPASATAKPETEESAAE